MVGCRDRLGNKCRARFRGRSRRREGKREHPATAAGGSKAASLSVAAAPPRRQATAAYQLRSIVSLPLCLSSVRSQVCVMVLRCSPRPYKPEEKRGESAAQWHPSLYPSVLFRIMNPSEGTNGSSSYLNKRLQNTLLYPFSS
jgi:hypothetical protein